MKPRKLVIFSLLIFCSNLTTYSYTIDSDDNNIIESQLSINVEYLSKDKVKVNDAELRDGLLTISCERIVPEHKKKKLIEIK